MAGDGSAEGETPEGDESSQVPTPDATLENLPASLRDALSQPGVSPQLVSMTLAAFSASYAGPLPPAEQFRAYEEVLPGSADRLLAMAERQQAHRMNLEQTAVNEASDRSRWGLRLGFIIAVLVIGVGAAAIFTGHPTAGLAVIIAQAAVLAGVFVYGRIDQRKERVEKEARTRLQPPQLGPPGLS